MIMYTPPDLDIADLFLRSQKVFNVEMKNSLVNQCELVINFLDSLNLCL